ncbi:hypothetical protein [Limisalsivibrio acetivorans]|uniref:hypothetical protein n=1 Tax=Limisalsivibrio acetivorans TaxID=1304888 RepID=UPI0003B4BEC3|nr:hypothetical protein [Limisalsivibrio acetivorans]
MDIRRLLTAVMITAVLISCAKVPEPTSAEKPRKDVKDVLEEEKAKIKLPPPPPPAPKPAMKKIDPLEDKFVTINASRESLSAVLFMIAAETGMNLVINPEIDTGREVTVNLAQTPASEALDIIMETSGLYYSIRGNVLNIRAYETETFKIPYVHSTTEYNSKLGGDIIGGASEDLSTIAGGFNLQFNNPRERNDLYEQISQGVASIVLAGTGEEGSSETTPASSGSEGGSGSSEGSVIAQSSGEEGFNLNMFTGTLTVTTTRKKMDKVRTYVKTVMEEVSKQVLIEAKLVEVILNDVNSYGINWQNAFNGNKISYSQNFGDIASRTMDSVGLTPVASIAQTTGGTLDGVLQMLSLQGEIKTLGNPRIRVVNGQSALISSGNLIPYWEKSIEQGEEGEDDTVTYNRVTILDGIMLGVTAFINDNKTITLNVVPVSTTVEDDKVQYDDSGAIAASFPVLNLKEAGTILKVMDGETVILGGMIDNYEEVEEQKVPVLGDVPLFGMLFKAKTTRKVKKELVIFLKTTVISK